jgi:hypothetical protein
MTPTRESSDARRLEWLAKEWGGQRHDFSNYVVLRGGVGDLSDIRGLVDEEMRIAARLAAGSSRGKK